MAQGRCVRVGRLKGAALGMGSVIVSLVVVGGATLLAIVATRVQAEYGPGCGVAIVLGVVLLAGGLLGAELFKNV